jgi:large subunit ribosomal protein L19e
MNLTTQKRLAAEIMDVGINKIWIDPAKTEDVSRAITRDDIRHFISSGAIIAEPDKGNSRGRFKKAMLQKSKGRRKGHGRRAGNKGARTPKKEKWVNKVRALRAELREMKKEKSIKTTYRKAYRQIKGNLYHSRRHLRENVGTKK